MQVPTPQNHRIRCFNPPLISNQVQSEHTLIHFSIKLTWVILQNIGMKRNSKVSNQHLGNMKLIFLLLKFNKSLLLCSFSAQLLRDFLSMKFLRKSINLSIISNQQSGRISHLIKVNTHFYLIQIESHSS